MYYKETISVNCSIIFTEIVMNSRSIINGYNEDTTMKKIIALVLGISFCVVPLFAGDIPVFVNLGFSANSEYFMFGYYGIDVVTGKPYSEIFVVNTPKNDFTGDGIFRAQYSVTLEAGWNALAGFLDLYNKTSSVIKKYGIDHFNQGRLAFLAIDNESDSITYKDADGSEWQIVLNKKVTEASGAVSSSFSIEFTVTRAGTSKTFTAGNPGIVRKNVKNYIIRQIIIAPDGKTIVFIIEKEETGAKGTRYMVETYRMP